MDGLILCDKPAGRSSHDVSSGVRRALGGATAYTHRDAPFVLNIVGLWMDPAQTEAHQQWVRAFGQAIHPLATGEAYLNFLGDEGEDRVRAAYGPAIYDRLAEIKGRYDPTNFFRMNQNIRPRQQRTSLPTPAG